MVEIAPFENAKVNRNQVDLLDGKWRARTNFIEAADAQSPEAFMVENSPGRVLDTHFHEVDQFQVIVEGDGLLGKHQLALGGVHYARAYTPYGPIVAGKHGLSFLTLRRVMMKGANFLPEGRPILENVPDRQSWQVTDIVKPDAIAPAANDIEIRSLDKIKDEHGLSARFIALKAGVGARAPTPSDSGGQFIVVTKGSFTRENKQYRGLTVIYVSSDEDPLELSVGDEGLEALVLNFPKPLVARRTDAATNEVGGEDHSFGSWECGLCSFSYDEKQGAPEYGIAPGTRWADIPDDFVCPDCSALKADFDKSIPV